MQQPSPTKQFQARMEALVAERDLTGKSSEAIRDLKEGIGSANPSEVVKTELMEMLAEASQLTEIGDTNSDAAKNLVHRWRAMSSYAKRPSEAQQKVVQGAYEAALAESEARQTSLSFDPAALDFIREVMKGMKGRGELI